MDLVRFEVEKPFPGAYPKREGAVMELTRNGAFAVFIQMPQATPGEVKAFKQSFRGYSYLESSTDVPVAIWVFDFPSPHGPVDMTFNAKIVDPASVAKCLDTAGGVKNMMQFFLLDGPVLRGMKVVGISLEAMALFHATILKQLGLAYTPLEFERAVSALFSFSTQELFQMGRVFKHAGAK